MAHNHSRFRTPKTNRELRRLVKEWQERLRLQDWIVHARFADVKSNEEDKKIFSEGSYAYTKPLAHCKEAIVVIQPAAFLTGSVGCRDIEVTLVHELLHLHADAFDHFFTGSKREKRPTEFDAMEAFIELTAIALVEAKRGVPREGWNKG